MKTKKRRKTLFRSHSCHFDNIPLVKVILKNVKSERIIGGLNYFLRNPPRKVDLSIHYICVIDPFCISQTHFLRSVYSKIMQRGRVVKQTKTHPNETTMHQFSFQISFSHSPTFDHSTKLQSLTK